MLLLDKAACDPKLKLSDKVVFLRLVWRVNVKTGACFPSVGRIAKELSVTDRCVRGCLARLEQHGYIKRMINPGRTKANDYLIPGLNTEQRFHKTGTDIPKNRNDASPQIIKEKRKEKEADEDQQSGAGVTPASDPWVPPKMEEGQFQNELVNALGGGEQGWTVLTCLSAEMLDDLHQKHLDGEMTIGSAVEFVRSEFAAHAAVSVSHQTNDCRNEQGIEDGINFSERNRRMTAQSPN